MTNRFNLPELNFLEKAPEKIEAEMLNHITEATGLTLMRADPRRKFLQGLVAFISIERNRLEHALRQNRLSYAEDDALDHMGFEFDTERIEAKHAKTNIAVVLEEDRPPQTFVLDAGELVSVGDVYFALDSTIVIPVGENEATVAATCTEAGEIGNGYLVGEISTLVRPKPYVKAVQNITVSGGGAERESDDAYAERVHLAPESFSTAGPELAYVYWAKTASADIADAFARSPEEGRVGVYILMQNGRLPTQLELDEVANIINDKKVRPLTDFVTYHAPEKVDYEAFVTYWISSSNATVATIIQRQIEEEFRDYLVWQRTKIGRDVDLSELIRRLKNKGASRVAINSLMYVEVDKHQVAYEMNSSSLTFGGLADE